VKIKIYQSLRHERISILYGCMVKNILILKISSYAHIKENIVLFVCMNISSLLLSVVCVMQVWSIGLSKFWFS